MRERECEMVCGLARVDRQACVSGAKAETRQAKKAGKKSGQGVLERCREARLCVGSSFFSFALLLSGQVPASVEWDPGDAAREGRGEGVGWFGWARFTRSADPTM